MYLLDYQLLPSARVAELLSDVFGYELSEATLYTSRESCFAGLASLEAAIAAPGSTSRGAAPRQDGIAKELAIK